MIRVTVDQKGAVLRLTNLPKKATAALRTAITREVIELANYVKASKLSGQVLKNRTGNLRRAVRAYPPAVSLTIVRGEVAVDRAASKYGKVHEFGGRVNIPAHEVREHVRAGHQVRAHMVRAHGATYPERSFMRSSLRDRRAQIVQSIQRAVREAVA